MFKPLLSTPSSIAPTSVPRITPRPPAIDAPPSTTAAIASSSNDTPAFGCPLIKREVSTSPAMAAVKPLMPYTSNLKRGARTPDKRTASSLPPMA